MDNYTQNNESSQQPDYGNRYQQPQPVQPKQRNSMAIASFIFGILGLICCCCSPLGLILGVISLILVILSKHGQPFDPFAIAGLVLSILAILASLASFFYSLSVLNMMQDPMFNDMINSIMEQYESMPIK